MEVIDCSDLAPKPIEDKDLPYTFIPEKSLNWNETEIEVDSETKYTSKYLKDSSMRPRTEGKVLVPIAALQQLPGSCADLGPAVLLVDPAQRNAFFQKKRCTLSATELGFVLKRAGVFPTNGKVL